MPDPSQWTRIDDACDHFERAWTQQPRIEDFLLRVGQDSRSELFEELLRVEMQCRARIGCVTKKGYVERFHEREEVVNAVFEDLGCDATMTQLSRTKPKAVSGPHLTGCPQTSSTTDAVTSQFGDYELLEKLGQGGMGVVFKARQLSLRRLVALKMILAGAHASDAEIERFHAEAEAVAQLRHRHIVTIHEIGQQEGLHYFSMDFVAGKSLAECIKEQPLAPVEAAAHLEKVAAAIHYAHTEGILHRDIKPGNVIIDLRGQPRVTDFGLAKQITGGPQLTQTHDVMGSPSYMSPEQAMGTRSVDQLSDVYSLGATLYEALTGRPPFRANTTLETLQQVIHQDPAKPRELNNLIPEDLENICLKCLDKEASKRYRSAQELADDLGRFRRGEPVLARPIGRIAKLLRLCKRNPVTSLLTCSLAVAVICGLTGVILQWHRAERNLVRNGQLVHETLQALDEIAGFADDPRLLKYELLDYRKEMLESTRPFYSRLKNNALETKDARIARALAYHALAKLESRTGSDWMAVKLQESAVSMANSVAHDYPNEPDHLLRLAEFYAEWGAYKHQNYAASDYAETFRQAAKHARHLQAISTRHADDAASLLAVCENGIGNEFLDTGEFDSAQRHFQNGLESIERFPAGDPVHATVRQMLWLNLGITLDSTGKTSEARECFHKCIALARELPGEDSRGNYFVAAACEGLGELHLRRWEYNSAEIQFLKSLSILEELQSAQQVDAWHPQREYVWRLCRVRRLLAQTYRQNENLEAARKLLQQVMDDHQQLIKQHSDFSPAQIELWRCKVELARYQLQVGALAEAEKYYLEAVSEVLPLERREGRPLRPFQRARLADIYMDIAEVCTRQNRQQEAENYLAKCKLMWEKLAFIPNPDFRIAQTVADVRIGMLQARYGRDAEARTHLTTAAAELQRLLETYPDFRRSASELRIVTAELAKLDEASAERIVN